MGTLGEIVDLVAGLRLRKARALLIFLLHPVGRMHRSELILDLLWRDVEGQKAGSSLRQTVRQLRRVLGDDHVLQIRTGSSTIGIAQTGDWTPETELEQGLSKPDTFDAAAQTLRAYLQQLDLALGLSDSVDGWVGVVRAGLIARLQSVLEPHFDQPAAPLAAKAATLALELEPHLETAARCLMKHHWASGAAGRAVAVYDRLYQHLDEAFDQEPETATIELLAAIKLAPDGGAPQLRQPPRDKITLRVVGSDQPAGASTALPGFESVLVTDLRDRLACFREWTVLPPEAKDAEALRIRLSLNTDMVGHGLTVQAIAAPAGRVIWSTTVARPESGWIDKVRTLILQVAEALQIVVADRHRTDLAASLYDDWLRALALKSTWAHADEDQAVALLTDICQRAQGFGPAHAELAGIYNVRHVLRPGTFQSQDLADRALEHAFQAISLDQRDTRAHRVLAWCYCHQGDFDLAEFHFEQSLTLNPQNPHSIASSALGFAFTHNHARARDQMAAVAERFDTMSRFHHVYLAAAQYLTGNPAEAARQCDRAAGLMTTVGGWHSAALAQLGQHAAARDRFAEFCAEISAVWSGPEPASPQAIIDWFVACFPLREEADRAALKQTLQTLLPGTVVATSVAHIGDVDTYSTVKG